MYTYTTSIALSYKHIPHKEIARTNYLASSLDIYTGRTLVPNFSAPFTHPFTDKRPYYSNSLSLNRNIYPTSISL